MRPRLLILGVALALMLVVGLDGPTSAACHAFTVSVDPAEVVEGESVTVTIERDFNAAPSSIDVATADETAVGGTDYEALDETADFPDGGTEQTFTVATVDRDEAQGSRTFRVELDNPQGCSVNTNYDVGDPATVTIVDAEDPADTTTAPTQPGAESTTTADAAVTTTTTTVPATDVTQEATPTDGGLAETGNPSALLIGAIAVVAALAGIALLRRSRA